MAPMAKRLGPQPPPSTAKSAAARAWLAPQTTSMTPAFFSLRCQSQAAKAEPSTRKAVKPHRAAALILDRLAGAQAGGHAREEEMKA
jgi:hypothetical protein